jgi:tRNA threonylcarbamoyladenosine biosynthesis protein TsaE
MAQPLSPRPGETQTLQSDSPDTTFKLAAELAKYCQPGDILLLHGEMGAGKTHFCRGFCHGLGFSDLYEVDSPTYTIVNYYDAGPGVHHMDLFRLSGEGDLEEIELEDMLADKTIKLIEWPDRLKNLSLPSIRFVVTFVIDDETKRTVHIHEP